MSYNGEERRKSNQDLFERITVLETQRDDMQSDLRGIKTALDIIQTELTRYKGMLGGALFVISCIITVITLFKDWILGKWLPH